jgi:DNA polymerase-3 subunit delta
MFAERTLVEISDYDLFKADESDRETLVALLSDLPEHVCLVFVYDILGYAPDKRLKKLTAVLKDNATVVEFTAPPQSKLIKWIKTHVKDCGKQIDTPTAEYLAFITGGLMTALNTEIEKVCFYAAGDTVARADIDAVVTPVLDAVSWKLTDHIAGGRFNDASHVLVDLLNMREPPHKLIYVVTLKLRQLLAARLCLDGARGEKELMRICDIRFDFQARNLLASARKTTAERCARFVLLASETALLMNTGAAPESLLTELLIRLAACYKGRAAC